MKDFFYKCKTKAKQNIIRCVTYLIVVFSKLELWLNRNPNPNNNCVYLGRDKHHYSVPYTYIGQQVLVIYTQTTVKIYFKNECIATHLRNCGGSGHYSVVKEHLCSTHQLIFSKLLIYITC